MVIHVSNQFDSRKIVPHAGGLAEAAFYDTDDLELQPILSFLYDGSRDALLPAPSPILATVTVAADTALVDELVSPHLGIV
jgi:hypothetical protein